ncbi:MAG: lysoplasmalogenase [Clostridiales bacterium]|nr:lysoplasmalogenase [Clostridiales bacterium]
MLWIVFTAFGALSLACFLWFRDENGNVKALLFKTLTSIFFILTALSRLQEFNALSNENKLFFVLITGGLLFGLIGDISLDLKFIDKPNADAYTFGGMGTFAVGHILYIAAVICFFGLSLSATLISFAAALALAAAIIVTTLKIMKFDYGKFIVPASAYSLLLIFFTAVSIAALIEGSWEIQPAAVILTVGSICFLLSDMILSMTYFGGKKGRIFIISNHILYYAAQFLIALSIGLIRVA